MRKFIAPLVVATAMLGAMPAMAHEDMPVAGKITAVTAKTIQIKAKEGDTVTLDVDNNTSVMKDGKRVTLKDLKVGQSVDALGFGDSMSDLTAIDVTILAPGK
ncbi:MAG: DUF5666 domain-containing protein [bacterium]|nr:DUF5666 domain-containing protein [bacterium]